MFIIKEGSLSKNKEKFFSRIFYFDESDNLCLSPSNRARIPKFNRQTDIHEKESYIRRNAQGMLGFTNPLDIDIHTFIPCENPER